MSKLDTDLATIILRAKSQLPDDNYLPEMSKIVDEIKSACTEELVPIVSLLIEEVYRNHGAGGGLYIFLDDDNVTDTDILFCLSAMNSVSLTHIEEICAELLLMLTEAQRTKAILEAHI